MLYGLTRPVVGLRILFQRRGLLVRALLPVGLLGLVCAASAALSSATGAMDRLFAFYRTFSILAPLPSLAFAPLYSRLAADLHRHLGYGECSPRPLSIGAAIRRAIKQGILVALGVLPFTLLAGGLPIVGAWIVKLIAVAWGAYWVVANALDDACVLHPGEVQAALVAQERTFPSPWFARWLQRAADFVPIPLLTWPLRRFARLSAWLASDYRRELALMETHPILMVGFALGTVGLLATPVLNLLFRPVAIAAGVQALGYLEPAGAPPSEAPHPPRPLAPLDALQVLQATPIEPAPPAPSP